MGLISGIRAMRKMAKIKAGGREALSIADITSLIINLQDAKQNLTNSQFRAVYSLFQAMQSCRTRMDMDLTGYYEEAAIIINIFDQLAPYTKYSGMEKTEALFFMDGIQPLLDQLKPRSEVLLEHIKENNPELNKYFQEQDIEILLTEIVDGQRTQEDDDYINALMQNGYFLKREDATAFYGVLIANCLYGRDKALELMDRLFMKWINAETMENCDKAINGHIYVIQKIGYFCGVLVPNGMVTKEESEQLSKMYAEKCVQHDMESRKNEQ